MAEPKSTEAQRKETGGFSIKQGGMIVAGGSGPLADIGREATHYASVYRQDGLVQVRVWRHKSRAKTEAGK
jgi:hypothetical protein